MTLLVAFLVDIEQNGIAFEKFSAVDNLNLSFLPNSICYFVYDGCSCINILLSSCHCYTESIFLDFEI